jgi:hypothetical protein
MTRKSIENAILCLDNFTITGYPEDLQKLRKSLYEALDCSKIDKLEKFAHELKNMRDVQDSFIKNCDDKYHHGLYNGLEFSLSLLEKREPEFKEIK